MRSGTYGTPLVDDPARLVGVVAVGVDETTFLAALAGAATQFVTGIVAMPGPGQACAQLLDVVPGRTRTAVQDWFSGCDPAWRQRIRTASLDPYRGYATALTASLLHAHRTRRSTRRSTSEPQRVAARARGVPADRPGSFSAAGGPGKGLEGT